MGCTSSKAVKIKTIETEFPYGDQSKAHKLSRSHFELTG